MAESRTIGVFGAGWVGLVTGGCFAELGHEVIVRDVMPERIEALRAGEVPFHEADLPEVLERNRDRIRYTLDAGDLAYADALFICVQTPPTYSGDADLSFVRNVAANEQVARVLAANGFTQEEVNQRLAQMSSQDLHQLANNLDQLQAAGLTRQEWIWIGIGALAALILIVAIG